MEKVKHYTEFKEFVGDAELLIEKNPMLYHFLGISIDRVIDGEAKVHRMFKIERNGKMIMVFLTTEFCLIYDDDFDESLTSILSKEIEFDKFNRYQFAGTKQTIDALFELNGASYKMQKHRTIYKCCKVNDGFATTTGQMEMADIRRLDKLVKLSDGFANEYYGNDHLPDDAHSRVIAGIEADSLYQWVDNDQVCSIAQSLHHDYDFPVIGHFYTDPDLRGKGYGTSIVHSLTKGLLGMGHEFVMLSTNALTPASNRVFQKVGYVKTGEYLLAYKDKK